MKRSLALATVTVASLTSAVSRGWAAIQNTRDSLTAGSQAYDQGDFERAAALLSYGLDPAAGPEDSVWVVSLQKLSHALIEMDRAPLATLWLRWALRHHGRLRASDTDFPPAVFTAFADAALFVQRTQSDDSLADTRWEWPAGPAPAVTLGALRVTTNADSVQDVDAALTLGGLVTLGDFRLGQLRHLPPGTYTVVASGTGLREARVEREVLPGVVTDLHVRLQPVNPTLVYVTAYPPFAELFLDGDLVGPAAGPGRSRYSVIIEGKRVSAIPRGYPLPTGRHKVSVRAPGYVPFDTTVVIGRLSEDVRFSVRLREDKGGRP